MKLTIDHDVLARNLRVIMQMAGPGQTMIGSIKANAYGHGAVEVAQALATLGVRILATGEVAQARAIRAAGIELPIVLFAGAMPDQLAELADEGFIPTITDWVGAQTLSTAGFDAAPVYIKVDVGLGRLGIPLAEAQETLLRIRDLPGLSLEGLYTHASFNDEAGKSWATNRLGAFDDLLDALRRRGLTFPITQARASSCVLAGLTDHCNSVCVGHALYGLAPMDDALMPGAAIKPVIQSMTTRVIQVTTHGQGADVAIAGLYKIDSAKRIGVLPIGRGCGFNRPQINSGAYVLIGGRRAPILAVSLEHTTIDLDRCEHVAVGDEVTLIGTSEDEQIRLVDYATWHAVGSLDVLMDFSGRAEIRVAQAH